MSRIIFLILAFAVTSLAAYGGWGLYGRPQAMVDIADGKLHCVSYAPYRDGQSPFIEGMVIPPAQIEEDIAALSQGFDCLRTYSVNQGLAEVPRIAAKYGMKVMLGVWIGRDRLKKGSNEKEIEIAVKLANDPANRDVIRAIVVGNEVLLRREFNPEQMANWILTVKKQVSIPVTYADVWEFWLKHKPVAEAVDFLTVHILPYWEDDPIAIDGSMAHLRKILVKMRDAFPGRTLFIGETGWPSAGRTREGAVPSLANQARYIREFVHTVGEEGVDYNVIEAIDQNWKKVQEGTVGGHWGIFNTERQLKFPYTGPVSDRPQWRSAAAFSIAIAAVLLVILWAVGLPFGWLGGVATVAAAQTTGALLVWQWQFLMETSQNIGTWMVNFTGMVLSGITALLLVLAIGETAAGRKSGMAPSRPMPTMAETLVWLVQLPRIHLLDRAMALGLLHYLTLFGATTIAMQMLFDPRYRDFPIATYLIPAVGFALLHWLSRGKTTEPNFDYREERWLACFMTGMTVINLIREGHANWESLAWTGTVLLIAAPWLRPAWRAYQAARRVTRGAA